MDDGEDEKLYDNKIEGSQITEGVVMNQSSNAAPANIENKLGPFVGRKIILDSILNCI